MGESSRCKQGEVRLRWSLGSFQQEDKAAGVHRTEEWKGERALETPSNTQQSIDGCIPTRKPLEAGERTP